MFIIKDACKKKKKSQRPTHVDMNSGPSVYSG